MSELEQYLLAKRLHPEAIEEVRSALKTAANCAEQLGDEVQARLLSRDSVEALLTAQAVLKVYVAQFDAFASSQVKASGLGEPLRRARGALAVLGRSCACGQSGTIPVAPVQLLNSKKS